MPQKDRPSTSPDQTIAPHKSKNNWKKAISVVDPQHRETLPDTSHMPRLGRMGGMDR
ncbi:MAG TPA: hypothetical protein VKB81_15855 [Nitrospira sp.]|nr:hypothetical protein [Nitrospira sp.]